MSWPPWPLPVAPAHGSLPARLAQLSWSSVAAYAWVVAAALGLLVFAVAWTRLFALVAGRVELVDGPLRAKLDELSLRAGAKRRVRLTVSPRIAAPITFGVVQPEISLPVRALTDLRPEQQESLLAHELGHALRRDPAWLGLCRLLETVLLVQPLNRVARRRLQETSELLSDDWAVRLTGRRLSLASCLTEVAQWVVGPHRALPAPGIAGGGSPLSRRIERLLVRDRADEVEPLEPAAGRERWWPASALGALGLAALAVPGFSLGRDLPADDADRAEPARVRALPPPPPPKAAPRAAGGGLVEEALLLEEELELVADELGLLRDELGRTGLGEDRRIEATLARIEQRLQSLRGRRDRLRTLLPAVLPLLEGASDPSPPPSDPRALAQGALLP